MNSRIRTVIVSTTQPGLALVELMVAMVIGLVLIGGVIQIFASNKQGYITHEALSRIQENGRYAMEIMSRNTRMAGFTGCAALDTTPMNQVAKNIPWGGLSTDTALRGFEYDGSNWTPNYDDPVFGAPASVVAGTDLINVNRGADCGAYLAAPMLIDTDPIVINGDNGCGFQNDDVVIISDCDRTDIFRISNSPPPSSLNPISLEHAAETYNDTSRLSKPYGMNARVFKLSTYDYYVRGNSLYVREDGVVSELVEGVEDMQITYGRDSDTADSERIVDTYLDAGSVGSNSWDDVLSVRITLGLRSMSDNVTLDNNPLRKTMRATIGVRNRLP